MGMALVLDTLAYANKLKEAGVPEKQAEVQVEMLAMIIDEKLATKNDLFSVKKELEIKMAEIKRDLELKMAELKSELIKWVLGVSVAQAAIIISCIKLIH